MSWLVNDLILQTWPLELRLLYYRNFSEIHVHVHIHMIVHVVHYHVLHVMWICMHVQYIYMYVHVNVHVYVRVVLLWWRSLVCWCVWYLDLSLSLTCVIHLLCIHDDLVYMFTYITLCVLHYTCIPWTTCTMYISIHVHACSRLCCWSMQYKRTCRIEKQSRYICSQYINNEWPWSTLVLHRL